MERPWVCVRCCAGSTVGNEILEHAKTCPLLQPVPHECPSAGDNLLQQWRVHMRLHGRRISLWGGQSVHCGEWVHAMSIPRALDCEGSFIGHVQSRRNSRRGRTCVFRFQLADSDALSDHARGSIVGYVSPHGMTDVVRQLCGQTPLGRDLAGLVVGYIADCFAVDARAGSDNLCTCLFERGAQPCPPIVTPQQIMA